MEVIRGDCGKDGETSGIHLKNGQRDTAFLLLFFFFEGLIVLCRAIEATELT